MKFTALRCFTALHPFISLAALPLSYATSSLPNTQSIHTTITRSKHLHRHNTSTNHTLNQWMHNTEHQSATAAHNYKHYTPHRYQHTSSRRRREVMENGSIKHHSGTVAPSSKSCIRHNCQDILLLRHYATKKRNGCVSTKRLKGGE